MVDTYWHKIKQLKRFGMNDILKSRYCNNLYRTSILKTIHEFDVRKIL